jgi:hypothetical protein
MVKDQNVLEKNLLGRHIGQTNILILRNFYEGVLDVLDVLVILPPV